MNYFKSLVLIIVFLFTIGIKHMAGSADHSYHFTYHFNYDTLIHKTNKDIISLNGCNHLRIPGQPALQVKG